MEVVIGIVLVGVGCAVVDLILQGLLDSPLQKLHRWLKRVATKEPRAPDQLDCSLRSLSGTVHGIGAAWVFGAATISPGSISFTASGSAAEGTLIPIDSIGPADQDTSLGTHRYARLLLYTGDGQLEFSVRRSSVDRLREVVPARP